VGFISLGNSVYILAMVDTSDLRLLVSTLTVVITVSFLRLLYILPATSRSRHGDAELHRSESTPSHMVVVLGSGGHSGEMASLIRDFDPKKYTHRTYVMSSGDDISVSKAKEAEGKIQQKYRLYPSQSGKADPVTGFWEIRVVPRAREIHQRLLTTPFSSLRCLLGCVVTLRDIAQTSYISHGEYPDVIVTNGPATAVMVIFASLILKFFGVAPVKKMKTVYVESFARIHTLSLSGKILLWTGVCDVFIVQWLGLAKALNGKRVWPRVGYEGILV